mgnify:CR=1 FL=1
MPAKVQQQFYLSGQGPFLFLIKSLSEALQ